jgi:abhydrolase domain-containing protein 12
MTFHSLVKVTLLSVVAPMFIYLGILSLMVATPSLQTNVFYLHRVTLTWFKDLNVPESFGFLHNQVTPFYLDTADGERLHAWHVLPLGLYRRHEISLLGQPSGIAQDITTKLAFKLLHDDRDSRLIIYLHGAAGTLASGYRPDSYRALYSGDPDKIYVLTVDYRGYGYSSGTPSEEGLLLDAVAVANWAIHVARIPPSRIVVFGQSLGTAVGISLSAHFAAQSPSVSFAGVVLVASFSDVATLTGTYRIGGIMPVLSPLGVFPRLLTFFNGFLPSTWLSKDRMAEFVRRCEAEAECGTYHITFIHAEDDTEIPWLHTEILYWHAVNATIPLGITYEELEQQKERKKTDLGAEGWVMDWQTKRGVIRKKILKYGVHDKLMSYPAMSLAVVRALQSAESKFGNQRSVE